MAKKFFPDEDPVGKRIQLTGGQTNEDEVYSDIVGVVGDVKNYGLHLETPCRSMNHTHSSLFPFMTLVLRADGDPIGLNEAIRNEILNLDSSSLSLTYLCSTICSASTAEPELQGLLFGTFAAVAVVLAAGLLIRRDVLRGRASYAGDRNPNGIGRKASGCAPVDFCAMALGSTLCGVFIGLFAAWAVTRLLINLLHNVSANDPLTFIGVRSC